jgi:hypothetical protein
MNKERKAFEKGWVEGKFFMKNYGSLLGEDKKAIIEQINEDWCNYKRDRFHLKIIKSRNTNNDNGYVTYTLELKYNNIKWRWWFWTKKLGTGDNGERCIG